MATGQQRRARTGPQVTKIGDYTLHGGRAGVRLTISTDLDSEPFPNEVGTEVSVKLVEPDDGREPYLEIHPINTE